MAGEGGAGSRPLAGLRYMSCKSGKNSNLQRGQRHWVLFPRLVDIGRGEPEDDGRDRVEPVNASELFGSKFIVDPML